MRNLNLNLATAMAASSAISEDATTDDQRHEQAVLQEVPVRQPDDAAVEHGAEVGQGGMAGNGCGVREYHSVAGLNAVDTIQKIGNRVISATSSPSRFSPARRVRRVQNRLRDLAEGPGRPRGACGQDRHASAPSLTDALT